MKNVKEYINFIYPEKVKNVIDRRKKRKRKRKRKMYCLDFITRTPNSNRCGIARKRPAPSMLGRFHTPGHSRGCLLYTSDAADDWLVV